MRAALLALLLATALVPEGGDAGDASVPDRFRRVFEGRVGERSAALELRREFDQLSGQIPGADRWLFGTIGPDLTFQLDEGGEDEGPAVEWIGRLAAGDDGRLEIQGERRVEGAPPEAVELVEARVALPGGAALVSRDLVEADSVAAWSFYAQVPAAVGPAHASLERLVAAAEAVIVEDLAEFRGYGGEAPDSFAMLLIEDGVGSFYESGYEVSLAEAGVIALQFGVSTYFVGAAHPNHHSWSLVWDVEAAAPLALADVFRPGVDGVAWVSERAIAALLADPEEMSDPEWVREGAGPDPANFASWVPAPEGLRLTFDPYQVAAYAAGSRDVVIPWSEVAPALDPAGPLAAVAAARGARVP